MPFQPDYRDPVSESPGVVDFKRKGWSTAQLEGENWVRLIAHLTPLIAELRQRHDNVPPPDRTFLDSSIELTETKHQEARQLLRGALADRFNDLLSEFFGPSWRLRYAKLAYFDALDTGMFSYGSPTSSPKKYSPWHLDMNVNELKVNLYLSDVSPENGPMRYITGSHLLHAPALLDRAVLHAHRWGYGNSFADSWMMTPEALSVFHRLPRYFRKRNIIGDTYGDSWPQFEREFAGNLAEFTGPTGTAILFESLGLHMGGLVRDGSRTAIQVNLSQ